MEMYNEIEDKELRAKLLTRQNLIIFPELFVNYKPVGTCFPKEFARIVSTIREMEVRADDIFVCSLPRSGKSILHINNRTTWNLIEHLFRYNMVSRNGLAFK